MCRPDEETRPRRIWVRGSSVFHGHHGYGLVENPCDPDGWVLASFASAPAIKCAHDLLTPDLRPLAVEDLFGPN
ncbi:Beta-lactamase-related domain-containing protein [Novosphingobium lubricantis]|uniref:hypothetical protein n=1 Tax=Sphingomonadaceae TaxID=41297 RepID=UPI000302691E|nr:MULTISPECIES: hypothetical protein [Sphingomonadaceae]AIT82536.1 hypothetical protein JI59_24000 [Novosphingobium pentaromativorans US6-1]KKC26867.1 hypothetical protein WP12_06600 [Sphingomonas sp. SRS2]